MTAVKRLDDDVIAAALHRLAGWQRVGDVLEKSVTLPAFGAAIAWVNAVADVAEAFDHHPDILIRYRTVTLSLTTKDCGGLTDLDLDVAAAIDALPAPAALN